MNFPKGFRARAQEFHSLTSLGKKRRFILGNFTGIPRFSPKFSLKGHLPFPGNLGELLTPGEIFRQPRGFIHSTFDSLGNFNLCGRNARTNDSFWGVPSQIFCHHPCPMKGELMFFPPVVRSAVVFHLISLETEPSCTRILRPSYGTSLGGHFSFAVFLSPINFRGGFFNPTLSLCGGILWAILWSSPFWGEYLTFPGVVYNWERRGHGLCNTRVQVWDQYGCCPWGSSCKGDKGGS